MKKQNTIGQVFPNNKISCHAEKVLFNISTLEKTQGRDLEQKPLRMTTNLNNTPHPTYGHLLPQGAKKHKGVTLIELLVVVLIIGILAAVALPMYQKAIPKSRVTTAIAGLKILTQAAEHYYMTYGFYPDDTVIPLEVGLANCKTSSGWIQCTSYGYDYNAGAAWEKVNQEDRIDARINMNTANSITYIQYLQHSPQYANTRKCVAVADTTQAHNLCKQLGGTLSNKNIGMYAKKLVYNLP